MRRTLPAWVVTALGAVAYLAINPPSADLAAQEYRVGLFERTGFTLWNNAWYGGHHTPAYSILFPPLGAAIGPQLTGAIAAVVAALLFERLARVRWGDGARWGALWFAAAMALNLVTGRLTFTLGVAVGLGALLALNSRRHVLAVVLAAATTLCSPIAGFFVALAAIAWALVSDGSALRSPRAARVATAAAAAGTGIVLTALFPEGGTEPFAASAFWPALAAIAGVALVVPARDRALRLGAALYIVACTGTFLVDTPVGGNITRGGMLFAGPVLVCAASGARRRLLLLAAAIPLAYWPTYPAVRDAARANDDPSVHAAYYAPLLRYLESRPGAFRVEIPFTRNHWESYRVAPRIPLARGWERQLDRKDAPLFYAGRFSERRYRAWLHEYAVRYVALPDAPFDAAALAEAAFVARGAPWLRPVWRSEHWRVFEVQGAAPLAQGPVSSIAMQEDGFVLRARAPGTILVRVHHTRWWRVTAGNACVSKGPDRMTRVRVRAAGTIHVQARLTGSSCVR